MPHVSYATVTSGSTPPRSRARSPMAANRRSPTGSPGRQTAAVDLVGVAVMTGAPRARACHTVRCGQVITRGTPPRGGLPPSKPGFGTGTHDRHPCYPRRSAPREAFRVPSRRRQPACPRRAPPRLPLAGHGRQAQPRLDEALEQLGQAVVGSQRRARSTAARAIAPSPPTQATCAATVHTAAASSGHSSGTDRHRASRRWSRSSRSTARRRAPHRPRPAALAAPRAQPHAAPCRQGRPQHAPSPSGRSSSVGSTLGTSHAISPSRQGMSARPRARSATARRSGGRRPAPPGRAPRATRPPSVGDHAASGTATSTARSTPRHRHGSGATSSSTAPRDRSGERPRATYSATPGHVGRVRQRDALRRAARLGADRRVPTPVADHRDVDDVDAGPLELLDEGDEQGLAGVGFVLVARRR